ncbi:MULTISPECIES: SDR family oxidoreductase [unclassified Corynebacterium]|uniref:SDR family oxidoreductase n=1 Tax=unclassified Corynebacterium TaxID=2624378 RepID=UPI0029C9C9C8|nr:MULTISPECIES: SDR family oxidoreductase [unclassified Corynebacterium]WPF67182.1 SDR family oxidoreductase [Corynebacterium sp. 22KM0430]WPF69671.1 SDR family oxidoreductase [Corynebacterium sp. 21KM1197]
MSGPLLVLGATSEIGGELAVRLCRGRRVILAARRPEALDTQRLIDAGARGVDTLFFDATDLPSHRAVIEEAARLAGPPEIALVCFGILGEQSRAETDEHHAAQIATVDYTAQVVALTVLAEVMERGSMVAFSSIAGWRARRANYVYGSTKAGLDAFCQGLADRLHGGPLRLITARPGFVIGRMTEGMSPAPMSVYPHQVAEAVASEVTGGSGSRTLWIPGRLRFLAYIMRLVPRPLWRRMPR